jgi:hypothetical protein
MKTPKDHSQATPLRDDRGFSRVQPALEGGDDEELSRHSGEEDGSSDAKQSPGQLLAMQLKQRLEDANVNDKKKTLVYRVLEELGVEDEDSFNDIDHTTVLELCTSQPKVFRFIDASTVRHIFKNVLHHPNYMEATLPSEGVSSHTSNGHAGFYRPQYLSRPPVHEQNELQRAWNHRVKGDNPYPSHPNKINELHFRFRLPEYYEVYDRADDEERTKLIQLYAEFCEERPPLSISCRSWISKGHERGGTELSRWRLHWNDGVFVPSKDMPSSSSPSATEWGIKERKVKARRKSGRSSFLNPDDFSVFQKEATSLPDSPTVLSYARHTGGTTHLDDSSLQFASSGGGPGGLGDGVYIHDQANMTKEAKDRQVKQRAKIELNSLEKMPDWDGENESWADFSEYFIDLMTIAGHELVCRPNFLQNARILNWSAQDIVEARKFVYRQLGVATFKHKLARDAFVLAGPKHDGETVFHQLELDNALLSFSDEADVRESLRVFKPTTRESPLEMMARLTTLINKYNKLEDAEIWTPKKKVRVLLENLELWTDLKDLVGAVRLQLIDPTILLVEKIDAGDLQNPQLVSYESICRRARAMWKAFGKDGRHIKVNSLATGKQVSLSNDDSFKQLGQAVENLTKEVSVLRTQIPSSGKKAQPLANPGTDATDPHALPRSCLHVDCNETFTGGKFMQVCSECFNELKRSKVPLHLDGSFNGVNYTGKKLYLEDSDKSWHQSRGGWKVVCKTTRVTYFEPGVGNPSDEVGLFRSSGYPFGSASSRTEDNSLKTLAILRIKSSSLWKPLPLKKIFIGTDSNAGGSVTAEKSLLAHDPVVPVKFVVEGITAGAQAVTTTNGCGVATYLVQDRESQQFLIIKHGGFYVCAEDSITSTVSSSSQVGNFYNSTKGLQGAQYHTANPEKAFIQLPEGHSVDLIVNEAGAYGCWVEPLAPLDPRLLEYKTIWISEPGVYHPPGPALSVTLTVNNVKCLLVKPPEQTGFASSRFPHRRRPQTCQH